MTRIGSKMILCDFAFLLSHSSYVDRHSNHQLFVPTTTERKQLFPEEIDSIQDCISVLVCSSKFMACGGTHSSNAHITASSSQKRPHFDIDGSVLSALAGATIDFDNASNSSGYSTLA
jgi:hypothetical protein